jgi:hypothetical protein
VPLLFGEGESDCRNKISQSFARSRAGFDDEVATFFKRPQTGFRHPNLPAAKFVLGVMFGDETIAPKNTFHFGWLFNSLP